METRGLIANVRAEARASLKQPSRPFTPTSRGRLRPGHGGLDSSWGQARPPEPVWRPAAADEEDDSADEDDDDEGDGDGDDEPPREEFQPPTRRGPGDDEPVESEDEDEPAWLDLGLSEAKAEDAEAREAKGGGGARAEMDAALAELVRGLRASCRAMERGDDPLPGVRAAEPSVELLGSSKAYLEAPQARAAWRQALGALTQLSDHEDLDVRAAACALALRMIASPHVGLRGQGDKRLRVRRTQALRVVARLFELSADEEHDEALAREQVAPAMLLLLRRHLDGTRYPRKVLLYAAAVIKNVAETNAALPLLVQHGAFDILVRLTRLPADDVAEEDAPGADERWLCPAAQVLVQVTAALRFLSAPKQLRRALLDADAVEALCALLEPYAGDLEVSLNVMGALWKLTLSEESRARINRQPDVLDALLRSLQTAELGVPGGYASLTLHRVRLRALFVLGNLTTTNSENRWAVGVRYHGVPLFVTLLRGYTDLYFELATGVLEREEEEQQQQQQQQEEDGGSAEGQELRRLRKELAEVEETLIKLVRAIANVGAHPEVGPLVGRADGIEAFVALLEYASAARREELMLNCVAAITNLSYFDYSVAEGCFRTENRILAMRGELAEVLVPVAMQDNEEAISESLRAYGNLSRCPRVRAVVVERRVGELLVLLLAHRSRDITRSACGVLVNLASDRAARQVLTDNDREGCHALVSLLRHAGLRDLPMSTLACQVLYNYLLTRESGSSAASALGPQLFELLLLTLEETRDAVRETAEAEGRDSPAGRFADVATALQRLQTGGGVPRPPSLPSA